VNSTVIRVNFGYNISCDFIENWNHFSRLFSNPDRYVGKLVADVNKVDFD
jgi:hypothetical protein